MGSVVMNGAHIGTGSIVAAGAVVTQGKQFPPGSVIAGRPGEGRAPGDRRRPAAHPRQRGRATTTGCPRRGKVRPVVRRPLPPAGMVPGDALS